MGQQDHTPAILDRMQGVQDTVCKVTVMRPVTGSISTRSGRSPARRAALSARALIETVRAAMGHAGTDLPVRSSPPSQQGNPVRSRMHL